MIDSFDDRTCGEVADDERFDIGDHPDMGPDPFIGECESCGKTAELHPELHDCAECLRVQAYGSCPTCSNPHPKYITKDGCCQDCIEK